MPECPPPPPGAQPPLWGDGAHVRGLLGDRVTDVVTERRTVTTEFTSPAAWLDYWRTEYGPTIAVDRAISGDADRVAALDRDLRAVAAHFSEGSDPAVMRWEYLLLTARRA
jgi:hypothetical protein